MTDASASNLSSCPAAGSSINASWTLGHGGAVFSDTPAIVRGHGTPRFGHTNNITAVMNGSQEEARSYLVGLVSASIVIFVVFVVWLAVVMALKFSGYKRVGFFSGSAVRLPPRPSVATSPTDELLEDAHLKHGEHDTGDEEEDDRKRYGESDPESVPHDVGDGNLDGGENENIVAADLNRETDLRKENTEELEAWEKQVNVIERRLRRIRIVVIFCGLTIVAMAIVMVVYGVRTLQSSVSDGKFGLVQGEGLANSGVDIINSFVYDQNSTVAAAHQVVSASNATICAEAKQSICSSAATGCSVLESYPSFLSGLDQLYIQLDGTKSDLTQAATLLNDIDEYISAFAWAFWVAAGFVLLYAICALVIVNGIILAWRSKLHGTCWQRTTSRIRGWFIVPLFVILLILGWIFSMVFVIGSAATGDFCYGSPDENVVVLLNQNEHRFSPSMFQALVFYASGCPTNTTAVVPLPPGMPNATELTGYLNMVYQAFDIVSSASDEIAAACGTTPETVQAALTVLGSQVCIITNTSAELLEFFACKNMNPVYAQVAYDALCYNGNTGMSVVTITQFIVLVCAMIMLTLRAAFYEVVDESELVDTRRCPICCSRNRRQHQPTCPPDPNSGEPNENRPGAPDEPPKALGSVEDNS